MKPREHSIEIVPRKTTFSVFFFIFHQEYQNTAFLFILFDLNWNTAFHLTLQMFSICHFNALRGEGEVCSGATGIVLWKKMCNLLHLYWHSWLNYYLQESWGRLLSAWTSECIGELAQLTVNPGRRKLRFWYTWAAQGAQGAVAESVFISPSLVLTKCVCGSSNLVHVDIICQIQEIPGREHTEFSVAMATCTAMLWNQCQYFGLLFVSAVE